MNFLYVVPLVLALSLGFTLVEKPSELQELLFNEVHLKGLIDRLVSIKNASLSSDRLDEQPSANLDAYLDAILPDINSAIQKAGYDPTSVPDQKVKYGLGTAKLTEGILSKLATIERYQDAIASYNEDEDKLELEFILRWEDLELVYRFKTKILIINASGHVTANVEHMKIHLKLGFDFHTDHVTVDALDFNHTGDIDLKFSGKGIAAHIINAMSTVFTGIFHNLILGMVKKVAMDPVNDVVEKINEAIDKLLHH